MEYGPQMLAEFDRHYRRVSLISLCMKLFRREIFADLRIPEGFIEEDSMVLPLILERTKTYAHVKLPLYHWRETPGSVTRSGLTARSFAYIEVSRFQAEFFAERNSPQAARLQREYLRKVLKYYYRIQDGAPELMQEFQTYLKQYRRLLPGYIRANGICAREKMAYIFFLINPQWARKSYMRVYGELYREEYW